jgi:hypothetical protein
MKRSSEERKSLARQFGADVDRMQHCLELYGKWAEVDDIVLAWASYSAPLSPYG